MQHPGYDPLARALPNYQSLIGARAPVIWRVTQSLFEQTIAIGATGAAVKYRWQRPLIIIGMQLFARSGALTDTAGLDLSWEDGQGDQVATDGIQPRTFCGQGCGENRGAPWAFNWIPLEIQVRHNDVHTFQVKNNSATTAVIPILLFQCIDDDTETPGAGWTP